MRWVRRHHHLVTATPERVDLLLLDSSTDIFLEVSMFVLVPEIFA